MIHLINAEELKPMHTTEPVVKQASKDANEGAAALFFAKEGIRSYEPTKIVAE